MNERIVENPNQVISGFGNKIKSIGEQFNTIENKTKKYGVYVENFSGDTNTGQIEKAIEYAKNNNIKNVYLACKDYTLERTLNIPSGIKLIGSGWERDSKTGTRILRNGNFKAITCLPVESEGKVYHSQGVEFYNICFIDYNQSNTDYFMYCEKCSMMIFDNCWFRGIYSTQLVFAEVMDSRLNNCVFEECKGDVSIKLVSNKTSDVTGYMLEFTNQIIFNDCRWEAYENSAVTNEGTNTNEIYFNNCKMESGVSNSRHLDLISCSVVNFNNLQIYAKTTMFLDYIINLKDCYGVFGTFLCELDESSDNITSFINLDNPNNNDFYVYLYSGISKITSNVVNVTNNWANNSYVNGSVKGTTKSVSTLPFKVNTFHTNQINFIGGGSTSSYYLKTYSTDTNSVVRVVRSTNSGDTVVSELDHNGNVVFNKNVFIRNGGLYLPKLSTQPWADNSNPVLYLDGNTNTLKVYINGVYKTIQTV